MIFISNDIYQFKGWGGVMKNVGSTSFLVPADKSIRLWTNLKQFMLHYNLQRILSGNSEDWF